MKDFIGKVGIAFYIIYSQIILEMHGSKNFNKLEYIFQNITTFSNKNFYKAKRIQRKNTRHSIKSIAEHYMLFYV